MQDSIFRIMNAIKCGFYKALHPFLWGHGIKLHGIPRIEVSHNVTFGKNIAINENVYIQGHGKVKIEDNVVLSYGSTILTRNLKYGSKGQGKTVDHYERNVEIGHDTWIAANVTILPGVIVPHNCIVAAGSVVTKSLPEPYACYAGNPAVYKKSINNDTN
ncbi:acyltransferase [Butyrivibrio sp. NC2007]|uniref:acyltransferase n=1 Tax=Butyrivibrio sp. NC2007 TaxID=1280683 RepID=UPI0003B30C0A|nr:acyltransferase [Butyrivibrio sp. NC2007]